MSTEPIEVIETAGIEVNIYARGRKSTIRQRISLEGVTAELTEQHFERAAAVASEQALKYLWAVSEGLTGNHASTKGSIA